MNDTKNLDVGEWQKLGGLQEANRQWFHPHGWALEVTRVNEDDGWKDVRTEGAKSLVLRLTDALIATAESQDKSSPESRGAVENLARELLNHLYPPGTVFLSGIWDAEEDPEGWMFGSWTEEDVARANAVHERRMYRFVSRSQLFKPNAVTWPAPQDPGEEEQSDIEPLDYEYPGDKE